jgi:hypothetical protein
VAASNPASFSGGNGTGAAATITYGVSGVVIDDPGSGYVNAADASITFSGGAAAATSVMTTDDSTYPYTRDFFNAIRISAYLSAADGGSSAVESDIVKQKHTRRFKVKNAQGSGVVSLVAASPAAGEATIIATDSSGKTYYVTKLTRHLATLTPYGASGHEFPLDAGGNQQSVNWTFDAPSSGSTVQVQNS